MHYADIADMVVEKELRQSVGATPANTVAAAITKDLNDPGASAFERVKPGIYMLRGDSVEKQIEAVESDADEASASIIKAFGMFWRRDHVQWSSSPRIFGAQGIGAEPVDISQQRGVYLLYDRQKCVYAGQAPEGAIGDRLRHHTRTRLSGRWDRFSWFGMWDITSDGEVKPPQHDAAPLANIVTAMEAVLIEALECPQNRQQGEGLKGIEYIQVRDPELDKLKMKEMIRKMEDQLISS